MDLEIIVRRFSWGWCLRFSLNRILLEYEQGVWEFHKGYGKRGIHRRWGKRHPYKPVLPEL